MGRKPRTVRVHSLTNQAVIADKCHVAERFVDRLRGLIGRTHLALGEGMLFPRCNNIHTWFMRMSIDVVFVHAKKYGGGESIWVVSSVRECVSPWRVLPLMDGDSTETLELPEGTVRRCVINVGDELCIS